MENWGLIIAYEILNPDTLLHTPASPLPALLSRNFGPLAKTLRGIVRKILWPILKKSGTLMEAALSQIGEKKKKELDGE